jgi:hypothetical protein
MADSREDPFDDRQLCPDGGCIGVIGPDGCCKVCGRAAENWGDERNRGLRHEQDPAVVEELEEKRIVGALDPAPDDLEERELCPDGSCIGVMGDDGRCRVCGKAA